ncbi:hypothetical protein LJ737_09935 [Hymenobacter sp. 15J16-1T3B]|uniref:hypothetical protein n=1 Tax=Hymenobacter sp. 15J16-1T3B TaxID=2886941 RepID=UPI001D106960|nr:hypothetical protein [Hymenobacter sp. 15J16-1T3B]MCC3157560.1 hypothetical protein [Hymenobacter sp. 15J16-1T3B]
MNTASSQPRSYSRFQATGGGYRPPYQPTAPVTGHYHRYRRTPRPPRVPESGASE